MPGRLVLISPHAFGCLPASGKILPVNLTRKQIEDSPPIESHKPVSRQYEEEYYEYYGWPYYWQGDGLWGMSGFPILSDKTKPFAGEPPAKTAAKRERADAHLRSAQAIMGYQIQAGEETAGHVTDFMMDDHSWMIGQLVVNTGGRFSGQRVFLGPSQVDRISWEESKVFVKVTKEVIQQSPVSENDLVNTTHDGPQIFRD